MLRRSQLVAAATVFSITFLGWLGSRWYDGQRVTDASLSGREDIFYCSCSCGGTSQRIAEYGGTLEPDEALQCVQYGGTRCGKIERSSSLSYGNCQIGGKKTPGGVIQPGI